MMRFLVLFLLVLSVSRPPAFGDDISAAFGEFPDVRMMKLSPAGDKVAFLQNRDSGPTLVVSDLSSFDNIAALAIETYKVREIEWANNETLILYSSLAERDVTVRRGRRENTAVFAVNTRKKKIERLLYGKRGQNRRQYAMGGVIGVDESGGYVYMPAYTDGDGRSAFGNLLKVSLDHGKGVVVAYADRHTDDYIVTPAGDVLARERFDDMSNVYELQIPGDLLDWKTVYREVSGLPPCGLIAATPDHQHIILDCASHSKPGAGLHKINVVSGEMTGPMTFPSGKVISSLLTDINRVMIGGRHTGIDSEFEFLDPAVQDDFTKFIRKFTGTSIKLESVSRNLEKMLFLVETGIGGAGKFILFDRTTGQIAGIASQYKSIPDAKVGRVHTVEYTAGDGLPIEGIVTWPPGVSPGSKKGLPLVVFPHGGPAAYDTVRFDYMAQYMASLGFVVLQPNFRGSSGYGWSFERAGDGEWGRKMQTDLSDGITALAERGWINPAKTCIVGWSYGGYAALAAATFQPDTYKCAIAGAPVSDLVLMLKDRQKKTGRESAVLDYWRRAMVAGQEDWSLLAAISPVNYADQIQIPVLLLHGTDDSVVEFSHSEAMAQALAISGKPYRFVRLQGEDHWLSREPTRIEALEETGRFLKEHLRDE